MDKIKILLALSAAIAVVGTANAATQIAVTSYSGPNGDGSAHGGGYDYWDGSYNGSGSTNVDGAALTGGTGDLTDGVIATQRWDVVEAPAGNGPYVGWVTTGTRNPLLTFNFAGSPTITSIEIQMDNSGYGGVVAPGSIWIDGVNTAFTAPTFGTVGVTTIGGLNLTGSSHTIEFRQQQGSWTFVSEIQFFGDTGAVPEPASWAMMIAGFGLAGAAMRRRSAKVAIA